ncbi:MAG: MFS transporter [Actinomycetota bacterium]|nr:MFS transporter [Actinomycetota bacterium]
MRGLRSLLAADFVLRMVGIACYTLFIAAIYDATGKASDIGFISAATVIPALIVALSAAKYIQKLSAWGTLRYLMLGRAVIFAVAALVPTSTVLILVVAALHSLINQAAVSAKMSLDAEILVEENRRTYNSGKTMFGNVAVIAGPPLGGIAVETLGFRSSLVVMAVLSLLVAAILSAVHRPVVEHDPTVSAESTSPVASIRYLRGLPYVAAVIAVYCLVAVILEVEAPLMFPFVSEIYHRDSGYAGVLLGLAGIGGIAGAFLAQRFPALFTEASIPVLIVLDGLIFLAFTQLGNSILADALFTLLGVMGAVTLIVVEGAVQKHVSKTHRPFVFSAMQFAAGAGGASLGIVTAFLAQAYGAKPVLAVCAIVELAAGFGCLGAGYLLGARRKALTHG